VLASRKFCGKKVFQKIQDGCWNEKHVLAAILDFLKKTLFPQNLRLANTK
jgi:hypothetical protein